MASVCSITLHPTVKNRRVFLSATATPFPSCSDAADKLLAWFASHLTGKQLPSDWVNDFCKSHVRTLGFQSSTLKTQIRDFSNVLC